MSWFFGRKKHHRESPPDTPPEEAIPGQSDDYIIIEKEENPLSPNPARTSGLYPSLGDGASGYPPAYPPTMQQQQFTSGESQNYLHGIPFKLSKHFDNDFEIDRLQVDEVMSFILNVQNETYDYDFTLEKSVINEMESGVDELNFSD